MAKNEQINERLCKKIVTFYFLALLRSENIDIEHLADSVVK